MAIHPLKPVLRSLLGSILLLCTAVAAEEDAAAPDYGFGLASNVAWCRDFAVVAGSKQNGWSLWVLRPRHRGLTAIPPTPFGSGPESTAAASCMPSGLVSPDAKWVALDQKVCAGYGVAYVLKRQQDDTLEPLPKAVSEMGWEEFFRQNPTLAKERGKMRGITDLGGSSICDLVGWEADSGGVWFSLRGGDRKGTGIYQWYFRWDASTGKVATPEAVGKINSFATARWGAVGNAALGAGQLAAEREHWRFLAELARGHASPSLRVPVARLSAMADERIKGGKQTSEDVRGILDRIRAELLQASRMTGAAATRDPSPE